MIVPRAYWDDPPPARTFEHNKPTLLASWWCTGFAVTIILLRMGGRYMRAEHLFREDKIMAIALLPLLFRMGLIHVVLLWGTNNADTTWLTDEDIRHREIGSRLVLAARIMYAAILWIEKLSIAETLYRFISQIFDRLYQRAVVALRWFLLLTFLGVVISTLAECRPLQRAWQVVPDPGPSCRLAYGQLATMGTANVVTDLILVVLPIPIILRSQMTAKRKTCLIFLFALSLGPIAVTLYRIPTLVDRRGNQQFRSLCASLEIFIATAASNALALGSFVRDRGPTKPRFRVASTIDSLSRSSTRRERPPTPGESEGNMTRSVGMYMEPEVEDAEVAHVARPSSITVCRIRAKLGPLVQGNRLDWPLPSPPVAQSPFEKQEVQPAPMLPPLPTPSPTDPSSLSTPGMSFFDVGGLLEDGRPPASVSSTPIVDLYASTPIIDYYAGSPTPDVVPVDLSEIERRTGTKVMLQDLGGLLSPARPTPDLQPSPPSSSAKELSSVRDVSSVSEMSSEDEPYQPIAGDGPIRPRRVEPSEFSRYAPSRPFSFEPLQDVGGLLSQHSRNR